ncbi:hypothetical protein DQG23_09045 [Paenibacillus contaminans]|uniref:Uncharacterized protein n=1 Tax=Paenibacillus contaminans TaxID=450362 RepID=A0A329MNS2_9BACL|nr:hypothetical protein DQG23_09045 [Paenibacillus contaminans]
MQDKLKKSVYSPISLFMHMRNQKCKVYENQVVTQEAFKRADDWYKIFGIQCLDEINFPN